MSPLIKAGRILYGIGIACIGIQHFIYGDSRPMILPEWPVWMHTPAIAYIIGAILVLSGAAIVLNKKAKELALVTGSMLLLFFVAFQVSYLLFIGPNSARHLGLWTNPLKELAIAGGGFIVAATLGASSNILAVGKVFFAITMIAFGIDHFLYPEFVATLVPAWIPGATFWTYFAGVALIGGGIAIMFDIKIAMIALLMAIMLFAWVIVLHIPRAVADPKGADGNEITSVFQALAFGGIALMLAGRYRKKQGTVIV